MYRGARRLPLPENDCPLGWDPTSDRASAWLSSSLEPSDAVVAHFLHLLGDSTGGCFMRQSGSEEPGAPWVAGLIIGAGLFVLLMAADVIPVDRDSLHAPRWILSAAGAVFVIGGTMAVRRTAKSFPQRRPRWRFHRMHGHHRDLDRVWSRRATVQWRRLARPSRDRWVSSAIPRPDRVRPELDSPLATRGFRRPSMCQATWDVPHPSCEDSGGCAARTATARTLTPTGGSRDVSYTTRPRLCF